jgi:hypothetical protein
MAGTAGFGVAIEFDGVFLGAGAAMVKQLVENVTKSKLNEWAPKKKPLLNLKQILLLGALDG